MRILLDTNIVLWAMSDSAKLSKTARREIEQASVVLVSAASIWKSRSRSLSVNSLSISMNSSRCSPTPVSSRCPSPGNTRSACMRCRFIIATRSIACLWSRQSVNRCGW